METPAPPAPQLPARQAQNMTGTINAPTGIVFPETILHTGITATLSTMVAVNAVMFAALALARILPKIHLHDRKRQRHELPVTRSTHPTSPVQNRPGRHRAIPQDPRTSQPGTPASRHRGRDKHQHAAGTESPARSRR